MKQSWPHRYQLWLRLTFVIIFSGVCFLGVQFADLYALQSFAPTGNGLKGAGLEPVAYVPVAKQALTGKGLDSTVFGGVEPPEARITEVGDGGDLGRRARRALEHHKPWVLGQLKKDVVYVSVGPAVDALGGELVWAENDTQASVVLPDALIGFTPGHATATRNYKPLELSAPVTIEYGQLRVPVTALEQLCGATIEPSKDGSYFTVTRGDKKLTVVVREHMYDMEVSRSGRSLQVRFLGEDIKQYPLCTGAGENTPVGHWVIESKAVWPPWTAYWGEYMPGGSAKNPLGARWLGTSARGRVTGWPIGIHGTNEPSSIGQRISGGCCRTYNSNAIELYNNIPMGTRVWIHE